MQFEIDTSDASNPVKPSHKAGWIRFLWNHNPFYVISAFLVLYGIQVTFRDGAQLAEGWLLLRLLGGYTLLLVGAGVLIIRVGAVWEDARTIVLLVLLLLVALSASFDKVCLDSESVGRQIQFIGFIFSVGVIELMLFGIRAKLAWRYRGPVYALFAVFFFYPTWLGGMSIRGGEDARMAWAIFLFPFFAGTGLLALMPAATNAGRGEWPNGTPWRWPLYPWCGVVFLVVASIVRSYGLSVSFELADGLQSAFHPYFLIPILLASIWLLTELTLSSGAHSMAATISRFAYGLLAIALPYRLNLVQADFLSVVQDNLGAPIQTTCLLLVAYFAYCWHRGLASAEWGVFAMATVWTCCRTTTVDLYTFEWPLFGPGLCVAAALILRGFVIRSSPRFLLGISVSLLSLASSTSMIRGETATFAVVIAVAATGLLFADDIAQFIRRHIHWLLWFVALAIVLVGQFGDVRVSRLEAASALIVLVVISVLYWYAEPSVRRLLHVVMTIVFLLGDTVTAFAVLLYSLVVSGSGNVWLGLGLLSLAVGVILSLSKHREIPRFDGLLHRWNIWLAERLTTQVN